MLKAIRRRFNHILGGAFGRASNSSLAAYYQSRLQTSTSAVEVEAIFSMCSLMAFNEEEQQSEDLK